METSSHNNDDLWYDLLLNGDRNVMSLVFNRYYARLCYFAQSLTGNESEAEDMAMKALSTLWEQAVAGIKIERMESYLFTIIRNACYDYIRHQKIKQRQESIPHDTSIENTIEAALIKEEVVTQVMLEIQQLPGKCRQVAEMMFIHGLNSEETARALDITASTVRSQKARAIQLLKTAFIKNKLLAAVIFFFE